MATLELEPSGASTLQQLQTQLAILNDAQRELQTTRTLTKSLFQSTPGETRRALQTLNAFQATALSDVTQGALRSASIREAEDGAEIDDYRRILTKPSIPQPRLVE